MGTTTTHSFTARRGGAGRIVFWVVALAVIGVLAYFIWAKKQGPPPEENKPPAAELAAYLSQQHKTAWDPANEPVFTVKDVEGIHPACNVWFGQDVYFDEIKGTDLKFQGAGEVQVPGPPNIHLQAGRSAQFRIENPDGTRVSVFLQKYMLPPNDDGSDILAKKTSYTLKKDPALAPSAPDIHVYRQAGIVYYLVTETPGGYDRVKAAFGWPDPIGPY